jgi:hypothetical protein
MQNGTRLQGKPSTSVWESGSAGPDSTMLTLQLPEGEIIASDFITDDHSEENLSKQLLIRPQPAF